jgi:FkbM family methyltransferase
VGDHRVLAKTTNGFKMFVDARDLSIGPHIILDGVWEEWTEAALRSVVKPGMTVFEVGANVGFFTLICAEAAGAHGNVIAFEPDPDLARITRDNVELNGFHRTTRVEELAMGAELGRAQFYRADRHRGNGSIVSGLEQISHNATDTRETIDVAITTLDAYCEASDLTPQVLKIDAEGAESAILRGAPDLIGSSVPLTIVMEFAPRFVEASGDSARDLLEHLRSLGFALHRIDERKRKISPASADGLLHFETSELVLIRS